MMEIIPAIDLLDGKCVRLEQGDYRLKKTYSKKPVDVAKKFESHGVKRLHIVDLDGARAKHVVNWRTLERIAGSTSLIIDFGGGIKSTEDIRIVFECGAHMAIIGSVAATNRELFESWLLSYGPDKMILGADVKNGRIAVSGWEEVTGIELISFLKDYRNMGVKQILCTDIARDGMLQGPSIDLYKQIRDEVPGLKIIASGGISSVDDLIRLQEEEIQAAIIGKAIYEGKIKLTDLKSFL
jgi:phosphoribosylformimino-5-aminoimidazole carboxamide ribotide isomerase